MAINETMGITMGDTLTRDELRHVATAIAGVIDVDNVFLLEEQFDLIVDEDFHAAEVDETGHFIEGSLLVSLAALVAVFLGEVVRDVVRDVLKEKVAKRIKRWFFGETPLPDAELTELRREISKTVDESKTLSEPQKIALQRGFLRLFDQVRDARPLVEGKSAATRSSRIRASFCADWECAKPISGLPSGCCSRSNSSFSRSSSTTISSVPRAMRFPIAELLPPLPSWSQC